MKAVHVAERDTAGGHHEAADHGDGHVVEVGDEVHHRHDDPRDELGLEARLVELLVLLVERGDGLLLVAEHLDHVVAGEHLLHVPVEVAGVLPLRRELFLRALGDEDRDDHRHRYHQHRDEGQQPADGEHHDEHADDRERGGDDLREALLQRLRDVVDVVGHAAEHVAARVVVEVLERQAGELLVRILPQPVHGALRHAGHDVALHPGEERTHQVDGDQQEQRAPEGGEVDALSRVQRHRREHVGLARVALGAQPGDSLRLGHAGRDLLADNALEEDVGGGPEDLRAQHREGHTDHGEHDDEGDAQTFVLQAPAEPAHRALEVLGLGRRHDQGVTAGPARTGAARATRRSARARGPGAAARPAAAALTPHSPRRAGRRRSRGTSRSTSAARRACRCRRSCRRPRAR